MPRKTRKQMTKIAKGRGRAAGRDGRSSASTSPMPRRSGGLVKKG